MPLHVHSAAPPAGIPTAGAPLLLRFRGRSCWRPDVANAAPTLLILEAIEPERMNRLHVFNASGQAMIDQQHHQ